MTKLTNEEIEIAVGELHEARREWTTIADESTRPDQKEWCLKSAAACSKAINFLEKQKQP